MGLKNNRGFFDWIVQRVTAILIGGYAIFLCFFFINHHPMNYGDWHALFSGVFVRSITVLIVLAIVWHTWISLWTVFTDYIKNGALRLFLEIAVIILLLGYVIWCFDILVSFQ